MPAEKCRRFIYASIALCAVFALNACGGGDSGQDTSTRAAISLELKNWESWSGEIASLETTYDDETKTVTLTHDEPDSRIAFSRQTISPVGKYRLQFSDKQGANRGQLGVADERQLSMAFASPAEQGWVDISATFPVDVEFAPGTEYFNVRIIFTGEATVGTLDLIPLGDDGEPLPEEPEPESPPMQDEEEDDPPTTF